ncbi:MAG: serine/threonine phosphatase [Elainellaceae cyanobacterium]
MIRCQQCGFDNPDIHKFCQQCGSALSDISTSQENPSESGTVDFEQPNSGQSEVDPSPKHHAPDPDSNSDFNGSASQSGSPYAESSPQTANGDTTVESNLASTPSAASVNSPTAQDQEIDSQTPNPVWAAILFPSALNVLIPGMGDRSQQRASEDSIDVPSCVAAIARVMGQRNFLDHHNRYQIVPPVATLNVHALDIEMNVIDCEPGKSTVIEHWADHSIVPDLSMALPTAFAPDQPLASNFSEEVTADINDIGDIDDTPAKYEDVAASFDQSRNDGSGNASPDILSPSEADGVDENQRETLPAIAQLYLTVQNQLYPSLPQIHDAWTEQECAIVLLEDRHHLFPFADSLKQPNVLAIQILHWLHEMVELWAIVEPLCCRRSILILDNLGVDEDQILCLKRLHLEMPTQEPTLQDLGHVWKDLLADHPVSAEHGFDSLYQELESGHIVTLDDLRERLETAADQLHDEISLVSSKNQALGNSPETTDVSFMARSPQGDPSGLMIDAASASDDEASWLADSEVDESLSELYADADEAPTIVLPMQMFSLSDAGSTDIGRQRDHNEDYFSINSSVDKQDTPSGRVLSAKGLYVLCDGMGGHAAGEVASALAVSTLQKHFEHFWSEQLPTQEEIRVAICEANQSIFELNQQNDRQGSGRMGTTLVMMLVQDTKVAIAHVGDSRVYRFSRRSGLEQLTIDHEVGQREIQRGTEPAIAYARPDAYQLTQALGPRGEKFISPDIHFFDINEDMLFLLCSDGLSDNDCLEQHSASHIEPMLSSQAILDHELRRLIDLANQHNGHDNITAVAVRIKMRPKIQGL